MSGQAKETAAGGGDLSRVGGSGAGAHSGPSQTAEAAPLEKVDSATANQDPKNVQELTTYIQSILQQMQDRFTVRNSPLKLPIMKDKLLFKLGH